MQFRKIFLHASLMFQFYGRKFTMNLIREKNNTRKSILKPPVKLLKVLKIFYLNTEYRQ